MRRRRRVRPWVRAHRRRVAVASTAALIVGTALAAGANGLLPWQTTKAPVASHYQFVTLKTGSLAQSVSASGTVGYGAAATVAAPANGTLSGLMATVGEVVTKGETLGQLDTASLRNTLLTAQIGLDSANAKLNQTQYPYSATDFQLAADAVNRDQQLVYAAQVKASQASSSVSGSGAATDPATALDQAEVQLAQAQATYVKEQAGPSTASVELAQNDVRSAQAALNAAQAALNAATLTAPIAGQVVAVGATAGSAVTPSTAIVTIADLTQMVVAATVNEVDISKVKVGQAVKLSVLALSGTPFNGTVASIGYTATTNQGVVTYPATITVTDAAGKLRAGMTATATLTTATVDNAVLVPNGALQGHSVLVRSASGALVKHTTTLGLAGTTQTAVTSGLSAGDVVAVPLTTNTSGSATTKGQQGPPGGGLGGPGGPGGAGPGGPGGPGGAPGAPGPKG